MAIEEKAPWLSGGAAIAAAGTQAGLPRAWFKIWAPSSHKGEEVGMTCLPVFSIDTGLMGSSGPSQRERERRVAYHTHKHTHVNTESSAVGSCLYDAVYLVGRKDLGMTIQLEKQGNKNN